jgi:hypothetical protein
MRELECAEDDQEADEQGREEVVAADAIVREFVRGRRHDETALRAREIALPQQEVGEAE